MSDLATDSHPSNNDESLVDPHRSPQASPIPVTDLPLILTDVNRKMTKALSRGSILVHRRLKAWALGGIAQVEILNRKHDVILISSY